MTQFAGIKAGSVARGCRCRTGRRDFGRRAGGASLFATVVERGLHDASLVDVSQTICRPAVSPASYAAVIFDLDGVITFRDIHDVDAMLPAAKTGKNAVVIGGGLLGLEAANGLMKNGMDVSVIHLIDTLMERQMDATSGDMLKQSLEERGMKFFMPRP